MKKWHLKKLSYKISGALFISLPANTFQHETSSATHNRLIPSSNLDRLPIQKG